MADPLSVTAGVVGITVPVLHGIRRLIDDIQKIVEAPETLHQLLADLVSLSLILNSIEAIEQSAWQNLGDHVFAQFKHTLELCERACKRFREDLNNWTGSSASDQLSWKGRFVVGFLRERQIKAMAVHIQGCKITCNCLIGVAVL
ncbi:uncharacterized protein K489DRAFT_321758 [Dissoconium aciculare CBS 342.82]|uniref:Azaphilone pigments biosynthesis cluster protein L N-terminal domain-containing protein n=1 Tax=Dissoconium aciculare CBS 342.82 TaxID=1314786 RepID=A0A6J3M3G3_9PEZI|nr:uncharacterized protein K489DRAFT_321758 [Dissoconium aciculare CBS 342.82]KAF1821467.1 hypothetical protein K489DRAFT_321758 [Dissoconium aciculare CBS 342.82]